VALFDWQGNELEVGNTPAWDGVIGREIRGAELQRVYETQQAAKD